MQKKQWLIIIFVVAIVGATVPAYFYEMQPLSIVGPAIMKVRTAGAFSAALTVATLAPDSMVKNVGGKPGDTVVPLSIVGQVQVNMPIGAAPSGTGTLALVGHGKDGKSLTLDVIAGQDGKSFARATNIPNADPKTGSALAGAEGVWYAMDAKTLAAYFLQDAGVVSGGPVGNLPASTWGSLLNDLSSNDMFGMPVLLDNKEVSGMPVSHFQLPLKRDAMVRFMQDLHSVVRGRALTNDERAAIAASVDNHDTTLALWIDSRRDEIRQMQIDVSPHDVNGSRFSMLAKFTSWNVPVTVTPPTDTHPFAEILSRLAHTTN